MHTVNMKGMQEMNTQVIADEIYKKLQSERHSIKSNYDNTKDDIAFFYVDDLLPEALAHQCYEVFPDKSNMRCLNSIREYKYVSAQMDKHDALLEHVIYAFQDDRIVNLIADICGIQSLYADELLYAGGISLMAKDNFLHPHLDNSHDAERERWRVLNLLYYVSPEWQEENGGHLELWPNGPKNEPVLIESKFNRLVVMATHHKSWHSVNKVTVNAPRCCISNYYFSDEPLKDEDRFHVTMYRGRPKDKITNLILDMDANLRMLVRKVFKKGVRKNPHIYKKKP